MRIEFLAEQYRLAHGKKPNGFGMWVFKFEGYEHFQLGTLTEAKKNVRAYIKETFNGCSRTIFVNVEP